MRKPGFWQEESAAQLPRIRPRCTTVAWLGRSTAKSPGGPGLWRTRGAALRRRMRRSRGLLDERGEAILDRFGGVGRDLLGERRQFLGLRGQRLDLLARMRGRNLDHLG